MYRDGDSNAGRVRELQSHWRGLGAVEGISVRMGVSNGFCTVGNFGSDLRLDYTILGSPVNLAARLQSMAEVDDMLIDENTKNLISSEVETVLLKYTQRFRKTHWSI